MNKNEFCENLDDLFEVDPGTITLEHKLQDFPNWDSLRFLGLISLVDSEYNVTLTPKVVLESQSIQDIYNRILAELKSAA